tara:strand:- start:198 stop:566 length:369 start_codon:yes stop_codon:yes gene_type:complete
MNKTDIVKKVIEKGNWSPKNDSSKTFYRFEIEMENGDVGQYSSIKENQDKFIVGQSVDYEYIGGDFPKIKPIYNKKNENNIDDKLMKKCVALKSASALLTGSNFSKEKCVEVAIYFENYLNG